MPVDRLIQSEAEVQTVAFTSEGASIVGACRDRKVRVWDLALGTVKQTLSLEDGDRMAARNTLNHSATTTCSFTRCLKSIGHGCSRRFATVNSTCSTT